MHSSLSASALLVLAALQSTPGADYQLGWFTMEPQGIYLDVRFPVGERFFVGAGASEGLINVASVEEVSHRSEDATGYVTYTYTDLPYVANASIHGLEAFGGMDLWKRGQFSTQASLGLGWALLDGTGEGQDGRSRDMLRIPARLEWAWRPLIWERIPSLGLVGAIGGEWRQGIDTPKLYREFSAMALLMRFGLTI
jgi:hypothetical protein